MNIIAVGTFFLLVCGLGSAAAFSLGDRLTGCCLAIGGLLLSVYSLFFMGAL